MHRHESSYKFPIMGADGVEFGTCACGLPVILQSVDSRKGRAIPRDVDAAHAEALAEFSAVTDIRAVGIIADGQARIIPIGFHEYLRAGRMVVDARDLYLIGYVFGGADCEPITRP